MMRIAWLFLPLASGCFLMEMSAPLLATGASEWYELEPVRKPLEEISRTVQGRIIHQGYSITGYDPTSAKIDSDWDVRLSPRWKEGHRSRLEVEFIKLETGGYKIRLRSWREYNDNAHYPMDAAKATWVGGAVDERHASHVPEPAMRLYQVLKLRFFGLSND